MQSENNLNNFEKNEFLGFLIFEPFCGQVLAYHGLEPAVLLKVVTG